MLTNESSKESNQKKVQQDIMRVVDSWIRTNKTPVPRKEIISQLSEEGKNEFAIINALNSLTKKGYISRTSGSSSTGTFYKQHRQYL